MKKLLEDFFRYYLGERNLECALVLLTEDVLSVGTGSQKAAKGKAELQKLMECEFQELPNPLNYEIYNYMAIPSTESVWNLFANLRVRLEPDSVEWDIESRLTCTCVKAGEEWKISCLHMSTPPIEQEENSFFPLHYGRKAVGKLSLESDTKLMELIHAAEHDSLTKLYNRKKAMSLIEEELAEHEGGMLFICDVDNFKRINDTKGHMIGDQVLRKLASMIQEEVSESAVTARLGGDEYIIFVPRTVMQESAVLMMQKIQKEFYEYMKSVAPELGTSLSVGGTVRKGTESIWVLYSNADKALYLAKRHKGDLKML